MNLWNFLLFCENPLFQIFQSTFCTIPYTQYNLAGLTLTWKQIIAVIVWIVSATEYLIVNCFKLKYKYHWMLWQWNVLLLWKHEFMWLEFPFVKVSDSNFKYVMIKTLCCFDSISKTVIKYFRSSGLVIFNLIAPDRGLIDSIQTWFVILRNPDVQIWVFHPEFWNFFA